MIKLLKRLIFVNQQGMAVATVIAIAAICIILSFSVAFLVESEQVLTVRHHRSNQAFHVAEAGASNYLWYLNHSNPQPHPGIGEGNWAQYESNGEVIGEYHVEVTEQENNSPDGRTITFQVTGRPISNSSIERTIEVKVRRPTFLDALWFTDDERGDQYASLGVYWWSNEKTGELWEGDECFGPLRTNRDLWIWGTPKFHQEVKFSSNAHIKNEVVDPKTTAGKEKLDGLVSSGVFLGGWSYVDAVAFPSDNTQLIVEAQDGGYYYSGDTTITLNGTDMRVQNSDPQSPDYQHPTGPNVNLPPNPHEVIYVNGNVYISGKLDGKLTVAANKNIYITDNLTYANNTNLDPGSNSCNDDVLGLLANENVYIRNASSGSEEIHPGTDREIDAAIMALNSFALENVSSANILGKLTVKGAIVQKFRGEVGKFSSTTGEQLSGFRKNYTYDQRLSYGRYEPPHFIKPTSYFYERTSWKEVRP